MSRSLNWISCTICSQVNNVYNHRQPVSHFSISGWGATDQGKSSRQECLCYLSRFVHFNRADRMWHDVLFFTNMIRSDVPLWRCLFFSSSSLCTLQLAVQRKRR
jgi:hypothetical protein